MLCHRKPSLCGFKSPSFEEGHESEGEDMYGFLPKKAAQPPTAIRSENIYSATPRRPVRKVTFQEDLPKANRIQRRHSCADTLRSYAARNYNYKPLIPLENLPSYPNISGLRRSASFIASSRCSHRRLQMPPPLAAAVAAVTAINRPPPPSYNVAVRRAASFSATRAVNRGPMVRRPSSQQKQFQSGRFANVGKCNILNKQLSSSTSELYVDAAVLKHNLSRKDLSAASSASSVSEATVYKKIGPYDYVSVSDKQPQHKIFRSSMESSSDDGVDVSFRSSVASSMDLEKGEQTSAVTLNYKRNNNAFDFSMGNQKDNVEDGELDAVLDELDALESQLKNIATSSSLKNNDATRTESTDNDSAYSDSVSLLSNESCASTNTSPLQKQPPPSADTKCDKFKTTQRNTKETDVKQFFVSVLFTDGTAKSVVVDENMKCGHVHKMLEGQNRLTRSTNWVLVEKLPELFMERVYEEHELLVQNIMLWTRDTKNKLYFEERPERQLVFEKPELFYPEHNHKLSHNALIEQYFSHGGLPILEASLFIKGECKKGWKKYLAVLKDNAIYYCKEKSSKSPKELKCLVTLEANQVYYGVGWKKKFKAPTEHCFAIKHPCVQYAKSSKYIKYLCVEDDLTLQKWIFAIRVLKFGHQLLDNHHLQLADDSELSDSNLSKCEITSEYDFSAGSIKRKQAKLPLTTTTRQLASLDIRSSNSTSLNHSDSFSSLPPPPAEFLGDSSDSENQVHEQEHEQFADIPPPPPPPPPRSFEPRSTTFVNNLQSAMRHNWQMAEKCKRDLNTSPPHEILGFRNSDHFREANLGNWVSENYGECENNLYENVYRSRTVVPARVNLPTVMNPLVPINTVQATVIKKRSPPPPPPPRAETTQLTSRQIC